LNKPLPNEKPLPALPPRPPTPPPERLCTRPQRKVEIRSNNPTPKYGKRDRLKAFFKFDNPFAKKKDPWEDEEANWGLFANVLGNPVSAPPVPDLSAGSRRGGATIWDADHSMGNMHGGMMWSAEQSVENWRRGITATQYMQQQDMGNGVEDTYTILDTEQRKMNRRAGIPAVWDAAQSTANRGGGPITVWDDDEGMGNWRRAMTAIHELDDTQAAQKRLNRQSILDVGLTALPEPVITEPVVPEAGRSRIWKCKRMGH
jgi:hypothetical protein